MTRLGELTLLATNGQASEEQLNELNFLMNKMQDGASLAQSWAGTSPGVIEPPTALVSGSGNVIVGDDGIRIYYDDILTGWLQHDGDWFVGSDISSADTTSLSIFSNAQTYNSESMGAGDVLFGSNSSGYANMLWDVSAKQLKFRGGTTVQAYVDTDGKIVFGGGVGTLDTEGITVAIGTAIDPTRAYKFSGATPDEELLGLFSYEYNSGGSHSYHLGLYSFDEGVDGIERYIKITTRVTGSADSSITLSAELLSGGTVVDANSFWIQIDRTGFKATTVDKTATAPIINEISTDGTFAGNSDTALPTEQAVVEYVTAQIAAISSGGGNLSRGWLGI